MFPADGFLARFRPILELNAQNFDPTCGAGNSNSCFGFWNAGGSGSAGDIRGLRFGGQGAETDLYNYAPLNYLQIPQERFSVHAAASFEISDFAEAYMRGIFTQNDSETKLAPAPTGSPYLLQSIIDNPAIPPALLSLILNDPGSYQGGPTANIRINRNDLKRSVTAPQCATAKP